MTIDIAISRLWQATWLVEVIRRDDHAVRLTGRQGREQIAITSLFGSELSSEVLHQIGALRPELILVLREEARKTEALRRTGGYK